MSKVPAKSDESAPVYCLCSVIVIVTILLLPMLSRSYETTPRNDVTDRPIYTMLLSLVPDTKLI